MNATKLRADLAGLHRAALAAADPAAAVQRMLRIEGDCLHAGGHSLSLRPSTRVRLVAFGKAAGGMTQAALEILGPRLSAGVVSQPHGTLAHGTFPADVRAFGAGHPLPDEGSLRAGQAALDLVRAAAADDIVLVLVSGGGSALFESLLPGVTLDELRRVTAALQHAGADIVELNVVRRALSRVKAGGLARAAGSAPVVSLILSDVVGDRLESIASGPTIESPVAAAAAIAVLERRGLATDFPGIAAALESAPPASPGATGHGERIALIVGSNRIAAEALCAEARARGFATQLLTDRMQGEARDIGRLVGSIARGMVEAGLPAAPPACLVFGGETTVTVRGSGRGGRNPELALGAALALDGCPRAAVFSFATDGVDGSSEAAGAIATGETIARANALGFPAHRALAENDTAPYFRALGDLWITGPSGTNVNDLVVALAYPAAD